MGFSFCLTAVSALNLPGHDKRAPDKTIFHESLVVIHLDH
jgi:hypothetical protein